MNNVKTFENREPKRINLLRWFVIGIILGLVFDIASFVTLGSVDVAVFIFYPIVGGFVLMAFRKWILRVFWA